MLHGDAHVFMGVDARAQACVARARGASVDISAARQEEQTNSLPSSPSPSPSASSACLRGGEGLPPPCPYSSYLLHAPLHQRLHRDVRAAWPSLGRDLHCTASCHRKAQPLY